MMTLQELEDQNPSALACSAFSGRAYTLSVPFDFRDLLGRSVTPLSVPFRIQEEEVLVEMYSVDGTDAKLLAGPLDIFKDETRWLCSNDTELINLIRAKLDELWHFKKNPGIKKLADQALAAFSQKVGRSLGPTPVVMAVNL